MKKRIFRDLQSYQILLKKMEERKKAFAIAQKIARNEQLTVQEQEFVNNKMKEMSNF